MKRTEIERRRKEKKERRKETFYFFESSVSIFDGIMKESTTNDVFVFYSAIHEDLLKKNEQTNKIKSAR